MIKPRTLSNFSSSCVAYGLASLSLGCAVGAESDQAALIQEVQRTVPVCRDSKECEVKWAAAREWVLRNSGRRLLQATDDYLETSPPINSSIQSIEVRVVKERQTDGSYRIAATVWCESYSGCYPDKWVATKRFNDSVNASWQPAVAQ